MYRISLSAVTLLAVILSACGGPPSTPNVPPPSVIIPDTTKVADTSTRDTLKAYDAESGVMRFSKSSPVLAKLKSGDVLVSEPSNAAPSGYLRKVQAVRQENGEVVLDTTQASLTDAITEGELNADFQLSGDDLLRTEGLPKGATLTAIPASRLKAQAGIGENYGFSLNFDHTFVPIQGPNATGTIRVNGGVNFNVGYGVDVGIHVFSSPHLTFQASVGFAQSSRLDITGDFQGVVGDAVPVGTQYFKPKTFFIGPVPVVLVPKVELYLTAGGEITAHVNFAASESVTAQVGARWTSKDGWKNISGFGITGSLPPPTFSGSLKPRVGMQSRASFTLYDVAGPEAALEAGVNLDVAYPRNPNWIVNGFLKGTLGFRVKLPILGTLASYNATIFDISKELGRSGNTPPNLTLTNQPHSVTAGKLVNFRAFCDAAGPTFGNGEFYSASDAEDGCPQITATSNLDGILSPDYAFQSPGTRTITVTARDAAGATAQLSFTLNVVNPPPPVVYVKYIGDPHPGEAYLMSAAIVTPDNADLCPFTTWEVDAPDTLSTSTGCDVAVSFGTTGARQIRVRTHDSQGTAASRTVTMNVLPSPANPYPKIAASGLYSSEVRRVLGHIECLAPAVSIGNTIDVAAQGCGFGAVQRYSTGVTVDNPAGEALTYDWKLIVTDAGGYLGGMNPPVPGQDYVYLESHDAVLTMRNTYPSGSATTPCRVTLALGALDPSRSKSLTVWSGKCTYSNSSFVLK